MKKRYQYQTWCIDALTVPIGERKNYYDCAQSQVCRVLATALRDQLNAWLTSSQQRSTISLSLGGAAAMEQWDGVRRIIWSKDLEEMEVIGTRTFSVGVPIDADPEFKAYVFAAGVTHSMGNQSIDYQLRRNYDDWVARHQPEGLRPAGSLPRLLQEVRSLVEKRCSALTEAPVDASNIGKCTATNVLIRLDATFRAAAQLIRLHLPFEAEAVVRLGYEQVAWAYAIHDKTSKEQIDAIGVTSGTTALKRLFIGAGRVYGRLSNLAHFAPSTHSRVIEDENGAMRIAIKSPEVARESALYLIVLLDAFLAVGECCRLSDVVKCTSYDPLRGKLIDARPARTLTSEYAQALPVDASATFDQWWR